MISVNLDRGRWSSATRRLYEMFWKAFCIYCAEQGTEALPASPDAIAGFLRASAPTHSTSWLSGALAAVIAVHEIHGHRVDVKGSAIRDTWAEIRREKGTKGTPKAALDDKAIRRIVKSIPAANVMDRAIVLFAFASLLRRSEIAALNVADLEFTPDALIVTVRRSKTDKTGKGAQVAVRRTRGPLCPVAALEAWLEVGQITVGPVFRNYYGDRIVPRAVADIAKHWAAAAGFDPKTIGAHSFRRGGITTMFRRGAKIEDIMGVSRHKTIGIALGYIEAQKAALNPALSKLGLDDG